MINLIYKTMNNEIENGVLAPEEEPETPKEETSDRAGASKDENADDKPIE